MTTIPAVVSILDLGTTATATSSMAFEASYTTASGNATTVQVSLTQIMTSIFGGLPTGGGTGQILSKINGADYSTQWVNIASAVLGTTGITTSGSTTVTVEFAAATPLSVLGVAGAATAAPLPIVASTGSQVLQTNPGGTGVVWGAVATAAGGLPAGGATGQLLGKDSATDYATQWSNVVGVNGSTVLSVYSNTSLATRVFDVHTSGFVRLNSVLFLSSPSGSPNQIYSKSGVGLQIVNAAGNAILASISDAGVVSFTSPLGVPSGGSGTTTLSAFGVTYGNGTSALGITAAGTTGWALVGNGSAAAPSFQQVSLTAGVTGVLTVPFGGIGTASLPANGVVLGSGASPLTVVPATTAGLVLTSQGSASAPAYAVAVTSFNSLTGVVTSNIVVQLFTTSGTYTPTAGMFHCIIECVGGGGGGGGAAGAGAQVYTGAGGGSGGYSRSIATSGAIGASQVVTVGAGGAPGNGTTNGSAGGTTSVGAFASANGGLGGQFCSNAQVGVGGAGGAAGAANAVAAAGNPGMAGFYNSVDAMTLVPSGGGGGSFFGGGGVGVFAANTSIIGVAGRAYGAGGSGGMVSSAVLSVIGGTGSTGFVVITEFVNL